MPFEIVSDDLVYMSVDAIVNTASRFPIIGVGLDAKIHRAAGPELLAARQKMGDIAPGESAITPGFCLPAKYVIHTVRPSWEGGTNNEDYLLNQCYVSALRCALDVGCDSVAIPLLTTRNYGFPKDLAVQLLSLSQKSRALVTRDPNLLPVLLGA